MSNIADQQKLVVEALKKLPEPLTGTAADNFFLAMQKVWTTADRHQLTSLDFTRIALFGPQSAGKSSIVERIIGFPITEVQAGIGTKRPLVVTLKRGGTQETYVGYECIAKSGSDYQMSDKTILQKGDSILKFVRDKNQQATERPIYLEIEGPDRHPLRFVDLPGYRMHGDTDEGKMLNGVIDSVLKEELSHDNTVILAVQQPQPYENSELKTAMKAIFGEDGWKQYLKRMIFVMSKSDTVLNTELLYKDELALKFLADYVHPANLGLHPIFVGNNAGEAVLKSRSSLTFDDISADLAGADQREEMVISSWVGDVRSSNSDSQIPVSEIRARALSFKIMKQILHRKIFERDHRNIGKLITQLQSFCSTIPPSIQALENEKSGLSLVKHGAANMAQTLARYIDDISHDGPEHLKTRVLGSSQALQTLGETLDNEFNDVKTAFQTKFTDETTVQSFTGTSSVHSSFLPNLEHHEMWMRYLKEAESVPVEFSDYHLASGDAFNRAVKAFAAHAFRYNQPSPDDLEILANLQGVGGEMSIDQPILRAKRLAEIYAVRLEPAISFFAEWNMHLARRMFETAWFALQSTALLQPIFKVLDDQLSVFKDELLTVFMNHVKDARDKCVDLVQADLKSQVDQLFAYHQNQHLSQGFLAAFPNSSAELKKAFEQYEAAPSGETQSVFDSIKDKFKEIVNPEASFKHFFKGLEDANDLLKKGIRHPISSMGHIYMKELISSPEMRDKICEALSPEDEKAEDFKDVTVPLSNKANKRLFGFTCVLYINFLPRFISCIISRFFGTFWFSLGKDGIVLKFSEKITELLADVEIEQRNTQIEAQITELQEKQLSLREALKNLHDLQKMSNHQR